MAISQIDIPLTQIILKHLRPRLSFEDCANALLGLLAGLATYISLKNSNMLLPDYLCFILLGIIIGWTLNKNLSLALFTAFSCAIACIYVFGFPSNMNQPYDSYTTMHSYSILSTTALLTAGASYFLSNSTKYVRFQAIFVLIMISANAAYSIYSLNLPINNPKSNVFLEESAKETYAFDGAIYLKTYYHMTRGMTYYEAMSLAFQQDQRFKTNPGEVLGYRLPTLFYLWKLLLPRGALWLNYGLIALTIFVIVSAFFIASRFLKPPLALVSPIFISTYFVNAGTTHWFSFAEFWGVAFCIIGINVYFLSSHKNLSRMETPLVALSMCLVLFAALIREQLVMIPFIMMISELFGDKKSRALLWLIPIIVFVAALFIHYYQVKPLVGKTTVNVSIWFSLKPKFRYLLEIMRFNCELFLYYPYISFFAVGAAIIGSLKTLSTKNKVMLSSLVVLPLIVFTFISSGKYWGALVMPFAFLLAPFIMLYIPQARAAQNERP
jgi:hypothetical protein